jgi:hypothetical protein
MKLLIVMKLVKGTAETGTTVDEWNGTYDLIGTPDTARGLLELFRITILRILVRKSMIVPTPEIKSK